MPLPSHQLSSTLLHIKLRISNQNRNLPKSSPLSNSIFCDFSLDIVQLFSNSIEFFVSVFQKKSLSYICCSITFERGLLFFHLELEFRKSRSGTKRSDSRPDRRFFGKRRPSLIRLFRRVKRGVIIRGPPNETRPWKALPFPCATQGGSLTRFSPRLCPGNRSCVSNVSRFGDPLDRILLVRMNNNNNNKDHAGFIRFDYIHPL